MQISEIPGVGFVAGGTSNNLQVWVRSGLAASAEGPRGPGYNMGPWCALEPAVDLSPGRSSFQFQNAMF